LTGFFADNALKVDLQENEAILKYSGDRTSAQKVEMFNVEFKTDDV
jgi:hypothetical protein